MKSDLSTKKFIYFKPGTFANEKNQEIFPMEQVSGDVMEDFPKFGVSVGLMTPNGPLQTVMPLPGDTPEMAFEHYDAVVKVGIEQLKMAFNASQNKLVVAKDAPMIFPGANGQKNRMGGA